MDEDNQPAQATHRRTYSPEEREQACYAAFEIMEGGASLNEAAEALGVDSTTLWRWCHANSELILLYDNMQLRRSRTYIEAAIHEIRTNPDNVRARVNATLYLRLAGLLNPKQYSDKTHVMALRNGGGAQRVSFTLNFQGGSQDKGALTVIAQPEDGEE